MIFNFTTSKFLDIPHVRIWNWAHGTESGGVFVCLFDKQGLCMFTGVTKRLFVKQTNHINLPGVLSRSARRGDESLSCLSAPRLTEMMDFGREPGRSQGAAEGLICWRLVSFPLLMCP